MNPDWMLVRPNPWWYTAWSIGCAAALGVMALVTAFPIWLRVTAIALVVAGYATAEIGRQAGIELINHYRRYGVEPMDAQSGRQGT